MSCIDKLPDADDRAILNKADLTDPKSREAALLEVAENILSEYNTFVQDVLNENGFLTEKVITDILPELKVTPVTTTTTEQPTTAPLPHLEPVKIQSQADFAANFEVKNGTIASGLQQFFPDQLIDAFNRITPKILMDAVQSLSSELKSLKGITTFKQLKAKVLPESNTPVSKKQETLLRKLLTKAYEVAPSITPWIQSFGRTVVNLTPEYLKGKKNTGAPLVKGLAKAIEQSGIKNFSLTSFVQLSDKKTGFQTWSSEVFNDLKTLQQHIMSIEGVKEQEAYDIAKKFTLFKDTAEKYVVPTDKLQNKLPTIYPLMWFMPTVNGEVRYALPNHLLFAMFINADNWLTTIGLGKPLENNKAIAEFFYGDSKHSLTKGDLNEAKPMEDGFKGQQIGNNLSTISEMMGINIFRDAGINRKKSNDPDTQDLLDRVYKDTERTVGRAALDILTNLQNRLAEEQNNPVLATEDGIKVLLHDSPLQITTFPVTFKFEGDEDIDPPKDRFYDKGDTVIFIQAVNIEKLAGVKVDYMDSFSRRNKAYEFITGNKHLNDGMPLQEASSDVAEDIRPKRGFTTPSGEIRETVLTLNKESWTASEALVPLLELAKVNSEVSLKLQKGVTDLDELAKTDQELLENRNLDIQNDYIHLIDAYEQNLLKEFYIQHGIMSNYRIFQRGYINPQSSHLHRIAVRNSKAIDTYGEGHTDINFFKFAVVFNMQFGPDKLTTKEVLANFDNILKDEFVQAAVTAYERKNWKAFAEAINLMIKEGGFDADPSLVAGIVAISKYQQANGKPFESDISYEVDGITNGYAISLLQYPLDSQNLYKRLNQVGVYLKHQIKDGDFESYLQGVQDLYTDLAEAFIRQLSSSKDVSPTGLHALNLLFDNQFEFGNSVTKKMRTLLKYPTMIYMYGGGPARIARETIQELLREAQMNIVRKRNEYNKLISVHEANRTEESKKRIEELGKYLSGVDEAIGLFNDGKHITDTKNRTIGTLDAPYDIKNFNLSHDEKTKNLRYALQSIFEKAFSASLEEVVGNVVKGRKAVNDVIELQTIVFTTKLEKKIAAFITAKSFTPSDDTVRRIIKTELREFFPSYKGPLDSQVDDIMQGLDMTNPSHSRSPTKVYDTPFSTNKDAFDVLYDQVDTDNITTTDKLPPSIIKFKEAGVRGAIIQIHNMDASIQSKSIMNSDAGRNILSLFDAGMGKPTTLLGAKAAYATAYNTWYVKLAETHDMSSIALGNLQNLRALLNANNELTNTESKDGFEYANEYLAKWKANVHRTITERSIESLSDILDSMESELQSNINIRKKVFEDFKNAGGLQSAQMFSHHMNPDLNPEVRKDKIHTPGTIGVSTAPVEITQMAEDVLFSLDVTPVNVMPNKTLLSARKVTDNTAKAIFETLSNISNDYYPDQESKQKHEQQLVNVFKLMLPVLNTLNGIKIDVNDVDSLTAGFASKHKNEIELNLSRNSIPPTLLAQTPTEVYTHETGHILITRAIKDNPVIAKELSKSLSKLQAYLKANGEYRAFLPEGHPDPDNQNDPDVIMAKMLYDYLLDNPGNTENELAEFMMLGLTNRSYINVLQQFKNPASTREGSTFIDYLVNLFNQLIDTLKRLVKGRVNNNAYQDLFAMATELTESQYKAKSKIESIIDFTSEKQKQFNKGLTKYAKKAHTRIANSQPSNPAIKGLRGLYGITATALSNSPTISKIKQTKIGQISNDFVRHTLQELGGVLTPVARALILELRQVVDKNRRFIEIEYLEEFKRIMGSLTRSDEKLLNTLFLKADLSSLLGIATNATDIRNYLTDQDKRDMEMDKLLKLLPNNPNLQAYMDEMANYIMTGDVDPKGVVKDGYDSVLSLAMGVLGDQYANKEDVLSSIDAYVTLKALSLDSTPKVSETLLKKLQKDDVLLHLLNDHRQYKLEVLDQLFDGDRYEMKKGYIKKRHNDFSSYKIGTIKDKAKMKALGYKTMHSLGILPGVNSDGKGFYEETFLYMSSFNPNAKLVSGALSFTEFVPGHKYDLRKLERVDGNIDETIMKKLMGQITKGQIIHPLKVRPIRKSWVTQDGRKGHGIIGYRIVIADEIENKRFGIDEKFQDTFAHMKSNLVDQVNSKMMAGKVIDYLIQEQTLFNKDSNHFVDILDKNSKYSEYYYRLPSYTKKLIRQNADEKGRFLIREGILNKMLGYEKYTLAGFVGIDMMKHPYAYRVINQFASVISYISHTAMGKVALGTTGVVVGNLMSNIYQLSLREISPIYTLRKMKEGYSLYNDYVKMYKKFYQLDQQVKRDNLPDTSVEAKEVTKLKIRLSQNPMHEFFEKGINSMIIEDINEASTTGIIEYGVYKAQETKLANNRIVKGLTAAAGEAYGSNNSYIFRTFKHFTAMTDMLSRYVMVEHAGDEAKKAGKNKVAIERIKSEALDNALEAFVVFDENVNPTLQLLSDLGMWWFARYYLRNQRVALELIKKNPTGVAAAFAIQNATGIEALGNINASLFGGRLSPQLLQQAKAVEIVTNPTYAIDQVLDIPGLVLP